MISSQYASRVTLLRDKVDSFERYPFSLPALRSFDELEFLRAGSFFNVATEIENLDAEPGAGAPLIGSYGGRSLHEQSHRESFLALMTERLVGKAPTSSTNRKLPSRRNVRLAVLSRIHDLVLDDSQFIIATHSPILMAYSDACIHRCDKQGISKVAYADTEHFQVTRDFLANPERMLRALMERRAA